MGVTALLAQLQPIGRAASGGYRRFAWTDVDLALREWFASTASAAGLSVTTDRGGNQWAWWGDPDASGPGVVTGSHLDSVPDGGAFDGPLGVASAFAAVDVLRAEQFVPSRPIGVVNFADEEGARFGVACAGSRLLTGALTAERALALTDPDGVSLADALARAGRSARVLGRDASALGRIGVFLELHIEQGRGLIELAAPVGIATGIWPHGRWRVELPGEANHAGTTRLADRRDPMVSYARLVLAARASAIRHGALATCGKVRVEPNGVNAIPSQVTGWLDARGPATDAVRQLVAELTELASSEGGTVAEESWTAAVSFDTALSDRLADLLGGVPRLATGAGHDAGVLAASGIPAAMLFVRNPTGVSHSPTEFAEPADCEAGVTALVAALRELAR
ncbi:MAG: allantoate amidohydrolase [Actinomycetota bacterium]